MKLLVITPTLGTSRWLDEAARSVAAVRGEIQHVMVCPPPVAADLGRRFPRVTIVGEKRAGLYPAINQGLAAVVDWEAFMWLNDDDVLEPDGLGAALAVLAAAPGPDVVYGRVGLMGAAGERLGALPVARRADDLRALLARGIVPLAQPGTVMRRTLVTRLGGLDESFRLAGDLDLFARALAAGGRFAWVDREVASFRLTAAQLSKDDATGAVEKLRALQALGPAGPAGGRAALWRFRWANLGVYFERVRRHGFVTMRHLYRHA